MGVLSDLEPRKVFYYFEELTKIPHGSGNVGRISDYLVAFAKEHGLEVIQDAVKNVIIFKDATAGYEQEPALILQGHMDMVAVKKPDCDINMRTEGLRVAVEGDRVYAEGTSLGGDDGIAVAYGLAVLDSKELQHPRLEVIFTVDEETGMDGARAIDVSMLKGNRLLNLDSEGEGIFLTSCAGGARVKCRLPMERSETEGFVCELTIGGLLGGHSGEEIHKERGNSNSLFGRVLWSLAEKMPIQLVSVQGGLADNAIARETKAELLIPSQSELGERIAGEPYNSNEFDECLEDLMMEIADELAVKDPGFQMSWKRDNKRQQALAVTVEDTKRAAAFLHVCPNGVQGMSADIGGLVETSLNLGILSFAEQSDGAWALTADFAVRSSVESAKKALIAKLVALTKLTGGFCEVTGDYPGWKYRADSPLREKMIRVYREMYGTDPKVEAIHAGLECGILGSKIKDLDCVAIGPDMKDIHTTEETLSISSTRRVWEYLVKLLAAKD
ncbi:MAG: aminoacyl-histidine dipeptidase [Butyrivibrio sp.]|nr:aminoacyl-histidine dipeptidase [Muribaculum sp.]MCM1553230.1 aminoacyl-histidine dipeptidase [Butyrivibrio sp.]